MNLTACFWQLSSRLLFPSSLTRRLVSSRLPHTRSLSVPNSSSRTLERDANAESSCPTNTEMHSVGSQMHPRNLQTLKTCNGRMQDAIDHAVPLSDALPPRRPPNRTITTLNPARLHSRCFVDISGVVGASIYAAFPSQDSYLESHPLIYYKRHRKRGTTKVEYDYDRVAFPPGTHGFLYFHANPHNPQHVQIRFCVTPDRDPVSFACGHDLLYDKGYVWYLSVAAIAARAPTDALLRLLLRDGLLDAQLIADMGDSAKIHHVRLRRAIGSLCEPFVISFAMYQHRITVVGDAYPIMLALLHFGYHNREHDVVHLYEEGSALCRFERSTLPEHAGKRAIMLRLLKTLVPPKHIPGHPSKFNLPLPAEGKLFTKHSRVWYRDVDKDSKKNRVLRMLYDVDEGPGPS